MSALAFLFSIGFFVLIGTVCIKGCDYVRRVAPSYIAHFYLAMGVVRMVLTLTVIALYIVLTDERESAIRFTAVFLIMYAIMMMAILVINIRRQIK